MGASPDIDVDPEGNQTLVRVDPQTAVSTRSANEGFEEETLFRNAHALPPPSGDPRDLNSIFRRSYALRGCIDAMVANIATPGFSLQPRVNLENEEALAQLREAVNISAALGEPSFVADGLIEAELEGRGLKPNDVAAFAADFEVSDATFEKIVARLRKIQRIDEFRLRAFFQTSTPGSNWLAVRKGREVDLHVHGYSFIEVILDHTTGTPVQLRQLESWTMRLLQEKLAPTEIDMTYHVSPASMAVKKQMVRFRLYAQKNEITGGLTYYKDILDPQMYSNCSGVAYDSLEALLAAEAAKEPNVRPANALIHFKTYDPESPYGAPVWWSTLSCIIGLQGAEKVNERYFDNKTIPAGILAITNGDVNAKEIKAIKRKWQDEVKGVDKFHNIMTLHVEGTKQPLSNGTVPQARVEFIALANASHSDGQFLEYANHCTDVIGIVFRLGRPVRGDMRDLNRATARTAVQLAEKQVFQPARSEFDLIINTLLLPLLGIYNVVYRSNTPDLTDSEELGKLLETVAKGGSMTVNESREIVSLITGQELRHIDKEWADHPMRMILSGYSSDEEGKPVPIVPDAEPVPPAKNQRGGEQTKS